MNTTGKTILCVDDDEVARYLMKEFIRRIGDYELCMADSGQACIDYVSQHSVDLVILDYMLGDMTGDQVCAEISSKSRNPDVPVIISSIVDRGDVRQSVECKNLVKIAQKPYSIEELKADIAKVFAS